MIFFQDIFYGLLFLHSLLLLAFLAKSKRLYMLQLFLIVFALHMGLNLTERVVEKDLTSHLAPILAQLYGPTLYLFFNQLVYKNFALEPKTSIHLIPATLTLVLVFFNPVNASIEILGGLVFLIYLGASLKLVLKAQPEIKEVYSDPWATNPNWIYHTLAGFILAGVFDFSSRAFYSANSTPSIFLQFGSLILLLATLTNMVWKAMNQPRVLYSNKESPTKKEVSQEILQNFKNKIEALFENKKLHLTPRLSVNEVAQHMGLSSREVSQFINLGFDKNFSDYVNEKRVEMAISLMKGSNLSILQIGYDSGFNSKTAFHDSFLKVKNMTPGEWKKIISPES